MCNVIPEFHVPSGESKALHMLSPRKEEQMRTKPLKGIRGIFWRSYIIWLALRWMPQINLGDLIWYAGSKYYVFNGVRCESWRLANFDNSDHGWVKRIDCKKVVSIKNYLQSFKSGYNFYMTSWFDIWVTEGIKPWMRACRIWPR